MFSFCVAFNPFPVSKIRICQICNHFIEIIKRRYRFSEISRKVPAHLECLIYIELFWKRTWCIFISIMQFITQNIHISHKNHTPFPRNNNFYLFCHNFYIPIVICEGISIPKPFIRSHNLLWHVKYLFGLRNKLMYVMLL